MPSVVGRIASVALALLALLSGVTPGFRRLAGAEEPPSALAGRIVLCGAQRRDSKTRSIELLDPTSLTMTTLATLDEGEIPVAMRIAPNGQSIAATLLSTATDETSRRVVVFSARGERQQVATNAVIVAWSPDSDKILVRHGGKYQWSHSIVDVASQTSAGIKLPHTDAVTDWSAQASKICVMAGRPERIFEQRPGEFYPRRQLYRFDFATSVSQPPLTGDADDCIKGRFSHDDAMLAYSRRTYSAGMPVELAEVMQLRNRATESICDFTALGVRPNLSPTWSPDDKTLAWQVTPASDRGDLNFELWFLPIDGSPPRKVAAQQLGVKFFGMFDW